MEENINNEQNAEAELESEHAQVSAPFTADSGNTSDEIIEKKKKKDSSSKGEHKIDILLKATGDTPIMKVHKWTLASNRTVGSVASFIKKYIKLSPIENIFIYVNQSFAPSPDQTILNLFECFGSDGKLVLHYCKSQAWG